MTTEFTNLTWRERLMMFAPLFLWIGVIFYLGSGGGSASETSRIIGPLIHFFFPDADPGWVQTIHGLIRKAAHVTEYGILAALTSRAVLLAGSDSLKRYWPLPALALVATVASIDEFSQSFNVQRTGTAWDVLLDFFGGLLAVGLIWIFRRRVAAAKGDPPA